jgi:hypothetical protein
VPACGGGPQGGIGYGDQDGKILLVHIENLRVIYDELFPKHVYSLSRSLAYHKVVASTTSCFRKTEFQGEG